MDWLITADDRTGALEVAGMCTTVGVVARVSTDLGAAAGPVVAIDLGSRHLPARQAARRMAAVVERPGRRAHKIDSLLRGNWASELLAVDRRTVVVPAFPAVGRTCRGGVVRADGVPVAELADARASAVTSRPAEALVADQVDAAQLGGWLAGSGRRAVCDAATDADLAAIAGLLDAHPEVVVAGPAGALAAAAHGAPPHPPLPLPRPVLVVCGSRHPASAVQLAVLRDLPGVDLVAPSGASDDPGAVAADLAAATHRRLDGLRTLVVIGGDTAAAVLGSDDVDVSGTVGPGMPWCASVLRRDLQLVTKAGAFGTPGTIAELFTPARR